MTFVLMKNMLCIDGTYYLAKGEAVMVRAYECDIRVGLWALLALQLSANMLMDD